MMNKFNYMYIYMKYKITMNIILNIYIYNIKNVV